MDERLDQLKAAAAAGKSKAQNTSLTKFEILWDYEQCLQNSSKEAIAALEGKFLNLLVKDLVVQDPAPPLRRVIAEWIVGLCEHTGAVKQVLLALKSFHTLIQQSTPLNTKLTAIECIGLIYAKVAIRVGSMAAESITLMIKQFKSSTPEKRAAALLAIRRIIEGSQQSGAFLHPQVLKAIKPMLADKEAIVKAAAAGVLEALGQYGPVAHVDKLLHLQMKLIEDRVFSVRSAAASAIGITLVVAFESSSQRNGAVGKGKKAPPPPASSKEPLQKDWSVSAALDFFNTNFLKGPGSNRREMRAGISQAAIIYLQKLPKTVIRTYIQVVITRLLELLLNNSMKHYNALTELLQAHFCVGRMLNDGLRGKLGEEGQKKMAKVLAAVLEKPGYNEYILILALRHLSYLFRDLGEGAASLWHVVEKPLAALLSHQSNSVRGVCAITARALATALPSQHAILLRAYLNVTTLEYAELSTCKPEAVKLHLGPLQGNAYAVAGLISSIPHSQLGVPNTITKFALKTAKTLIGLDASCKYAAMMVARTEAGWSIISALTTLGPSFVERKLPDLLDMWKECFQLSNIASTEKSVVVFCRLKSCSLEALCNFIQHNQSLMGEDVVEQAVLWLQKVLAVVTKLPKLQQYRPSTVDIINVLKAIIIKTYACLPVRSFSTVYVPLLTWLTHELPRNSTTSLFRTTLKKEDAPLGPWLQGSELREGKLIQSPAVVVHDHSVVWTSGVEKELTNPLPTSKKLVDEILELFPQLFLVLNPDHQKTVIFHLIRCIQESAPELKMSLQTNIFCLLIKTLQHFLAKRQCLPSKGKLLKTLHQFVQSYLSHPDAALRRAAGEVIGLLAMIQGDQFADILTNSITQTLKVSKEPIARAGCAFALGCILRALGGMKSSRHLPVAVSILHVLSKDPSPVTHTWALHALWLTIETTALAFAPFAAPTLSLAISLLLSKSVTEATYQSIGRVVNACVSCLGPELQANGSTFRTCAAIVGEWEASSKPDIQLEGIHFKQMLCLFAPHTVQAQEVLPYLRTYLEVDEKSLRGAAVVCLRQLLQINPPAVAEAGDGLEEQLLRMLDREKDPELRSALELLITSMVEYLGPTSISKYLLLFRNVISASSTARKGASAPGKAQQPELTEENEEELASEGGQLTQAFEAAEEDDSMFIPRWRTRVFCMECIGKLIETVRQDANPAHFDLKLALEVADVKAEGGAEYLVNFLPELVRTAFNAATSSINALRPVGVSVLRDIVESFAHAEDPEYEGHKLLELYAAQVAAALRPAFAPDCPPHLTAAACEVVVTFVGKTVTAEVSALSKVTLLLTNSIESVETLSFPAYSEKASTMVQLAILGALAKLHAFSMKGEVAMVLRELLAPSLPQLRLLWVSVLRDYAILSTQTLYTQKAYKGAFYSFSSIAFVLDYYKNVWREVLLASASLVNDKDRWAVHDARQLVGEAATKTPSQRALDDWLLLLGLCMQAFAETQNGAELAAILQAVGFLLESHYFAPNILLPKMFLELLSSLNMHSQIQSDTSVQLQIAKTMRSIVKGMRKDYLSTEGADPSLAGSIVQNVLEVTLHPLHKFISSPAAAESALLGDVVAVVMDTVEMLPTTIPDALLEPYAPCLAYLCSKTAQFSKDEASLTQALSSMGCILGREESQSTSFSALTSVLDNLESSAVSAGGVRSLVALLDLASPLEMPQALHNRCKLALQNAIEGQDADARRAAVSCLLTWTQKTMQVPKLAGVLADYVQTIIASVLMFLRHQRPTRQEEAVMLDCIKLLILAHSLAGSEEAKAVMMTIVVPSLVGLLQPCVVTAVPDFALQVIQTLAATNTETFKQIAADLPAAHRTLLANAVQKDAAAAEARRKAAERAAKRKKGPQKLTIDMSQYEEDE